MKFVADEGVDARLVSQLRADNHDVWYYAEVDHSTSDHVILEKARIEERILITRDKDFGELVFRDQMLHTGIILLRLEQLPSRSRVDLAIAFIRENGDRITGNFVVLSPSAARIRPIRLG